MPIHDLAVPWEREQSVPSAQIETNDNTAEIRAELAAGLMQRQAQTSPKYLYDVLGSKLFEAICELPEYYPTRTEAEIGRAHV